MTSWLRFLITVLRSTGRPRLRPDQESVVELRVWPTDADLAVMNHARYLTGMEQGRVDFMLRTGFLRFFLKQRWTALLGSMVVQFRRPLRHADPPGATDDRVARGGGAAAARPDPAVARARLVGGLLKRDPWQ